MVTIKKTHILRLDMSGRFALNVVDNLIIVHHQASKVSVHLQSYLKDLRKST